MISNIKNLVLISFLTSGFYIFFSEYNNLSNINYKYKKKIISELTENYVNENFDDKKDNSNNIENTSINKNTTKDKIKYVDLNKIEIIVSQGDTFMSILKKFNISESVIYNIINEVENYFDLKKLRINNKIIFYKNLNEIIKKIEINLDIDTVLVINIDEKISSEKRKLEKVLYKQAYEYEVMDSLYADGLKNNVPQDILIKLIRLFSFDLDFQRDIKKNTLISVSYEINQVKESNEIEYNDIIYAFISIEGKKLEYFKFITDEGYIDYFNREGKNVKKSILKTPLDGARLSSNFGMRKHPILGYNKMHKGVDFAAPKGTPIYAGGNGVIEYAGNKGSYGKYIRIRHNNEYKTAYAHLSGFKKGISKGVRVNQGDIIGFVGSTGRSTGPHLHYEIIYRNKQINPLTLKLPSGKILEGKELDRFIKEYKVIYADHLNLLYE